MFLCFFEILDKVKFYLPSEKIFYCFVNSLGFSVWDIILSVNTDNFYLFLFDKIVKAMEAVIGFIFLDSKITADGDCSHEIKILAPWKESYDKPRQ